MIDAAVGRASQAAARDGRDRQAALRPDRPARAGPVSAAGRAESALAWFDLQSGELTTAVAAESWPGHPPGTPGISRQRFALSHDDAWLAVVAAADEPGEQGGNRGPQSDLWRVPLAGGKPELIVHWPARIHDVCWRADDQALFIATERGGVHHDLWEVPLDRCRRRGAEAHVRPGRRKQPQRLGRRPLAALHRQPPRPDAARRSATWPAARSRSSRPSKRNFGSPDRLGRAEGRRGQPTTRPRPPASCSATRTASATRRPARCTACSAATCTSTCTITSGSSCPPASTRPLAARGPEHRAARQTFVVRAGETTSVTLRLERWTNQRADGWVSGENHIHANYGYGQWYNSPATMRLQCEGEDLTVANFMVANSDGDGVFDREFFLGRPDPLSTDRTILYWNEEFRSTIWGHMTLLNLQAAGRADLHRLQAHDAPARRAHQRRHRRPHARAGRPRQLHAPGQQPAGPLRQRLLRQGNARSTSPWARSTRST